MKFKNTYKLVLLILLSAINLQALEGECSVVAPENGPMPATPANEENSVTLPETGATSTPSVQVKAESATTQGENLQALETANSAAMPRTKSISTASSQVKVDSATTQAQEDEFFKKFADETKSDAVVYLAKKNRLLLIAYPSLLKSSIGLSLCSLIAVISFLLARHETNSDAQGKLVAACFFSTVGALGLLYKLIKDYGIRSNPIPHLIFDSVGLKNSEEKYILKWDEIENVIACIDADFVFTNCYANKYGEILFKLASNDDNLPTSYEKVKSILDYCLRKYGQSKFRQS